MNLIAVRYFGGRSARQLRPPGSLGIPPVDPLQHIAELRSGDRNDAIHRRWPVTPAALQPLGIERHSQAVMPKNLQQVTASAAEHVKIAGVRVTPQRLLNLQRKAVHPTPHVRHAAGQPYPHTRGRDDHRRSTDITRRNAASPMSWPNLIDVPSGIVISILSSDAAEACTAVTRTSASFPSPPAGAP